MREPFFNQAMSDLALDLGEWALNREFEEVGYADRITAAGMRSLQVTHGVSRKKGRRSQKSFSRAMFRESGRPASQNSR